MKKRTMITVGLLGLLLCIAGAIAGIYLFHSPLVYISFTYWPNIAPMAMAAINLIGFGSVAYMLTNLIRATNMGWIIGETPKASHDKKQGKQ